MPKVADYRVDQRKFDRRIAARTLDLTYTFVASHSGDKDATHEYELHSCLYTSPTLDHSSPSDC